MAQKIEVSSRTIEKRIANLKKAGLIKRMGSRKEGYWEVVE